MNTTFRGNLNSLETLKKCFFFATDQMEKVYIKAQNTWSHACIWTMLSNFCFNFQTVDSVFSHSTARTMICQIDYLFVIYLLISFSITFGHFSVALYVCGQWTTIHFPWQSSLQGWSILCNIIAFNKVIEYRFNN